jgi:dTDP-6-deoxy-L-talose 4-dehydrogenase (NAD+)
MDVLLTGGTGYIGRHVLPQLLEISNIKITALCRDVKKIDKKLINPRIKWLEQDLEHFDNNTYKKIGSPKNIIHLAWEGLPNYREDFHIQKNLPVHKKFLNILVSSGAKNILVTGTCLEYGIREGCLIEDMIASPSNPYAESKNMLRIYLESLQNKFDFSLKWLRVFYLYGPRQQAHTLIGQLDYLIESNGKEFDMSEGLQMRDYLHVSEVANYIVLCFMQNKVQGIINCCSSKPIRIRDLVFNYLKEKNSKISINFGVCTYPIYEPFSFWGSNEKLLNAVRKHE